MATMTTKAMNAIAVGTKTLTADTDAYVMIGVDGAVCGAAKKAAGVLLKDGASGENVAIHGGRVPVKLGGTIAANTQFESDASGLAVTIASGIACGVTEEAGDAGDIVMCHMDVL